MSRISGREVATTEQISTDLISNIIDLTYYNDQETQESGVLTLSLSPKCFWQGQNWRLNCKPGFHPPPPHSSISDQQQPDPHPFPVWAELCTEGASAPRHTSSSPHHPSPAEQLPAAQDSSFLPWGVTAWRARGWSATPRATEEVSAQLPARARDGPQCGSGPQTLPGWGVQRPEQPDRPRLLRGWGPRLDGTTRLRSSSLCCFSYTVARKGFWRLVRELSHPLRQMRIVLGTARLYLPSVCRSGPGPSSER